MYKTVGDLKKFLEGIPDSAEVFIAPMKLLSEVDYEKMCPIRAIDTNAFDVVIVWSDLPTVPFLELLSKFDKSYFGG